MNPTRAQRERIVKAAMRWYRQRSAKAIPGIYCIPHPEHQWMTAHDLHKAIAAARGRK